MQVLCVVWELAVIPFSHQFLMLENTFFFSWRVISTILRIKRLDLCEFFFQVFLSSAMIAQHGNISQLHSHPRFNKCRYFGCKPTLISLAFTFKNSRGFATIFTGNLKYSIQNKAKYVTLSLFLMQNKYFTFISTLFAKCMRIIFALKRSLT
jgi:hypothetical protein